MSLKEALFPNKPKIGPYSQFQSDHEEASEKISLNQLPERSAPLMNEDQQVLAEIEDNMMEEQMKHTKK